MQTTSAPPPPSERPRSVPRLVDEATRAAAASRRPPSRTTTTGSVAAVGRRGGGGGGNSSRRRGGRGGRLSGAPGLGLLLLPFGGGVLAVLLAALHTAMGAPFGAAFASDLWSACKQAGLMLAVYGPFAGYAHRANQNALAAQGGRRYALGEDPGRDGTEAEDGRPARQDGGGDRDDHDDRRRS